MKQMIQRMREEKGGFTLAELLIVVAIVAVLVAIAIPVFTAQLDRANAAVDEANIRSGYGWVQSFAMGDKTKDDTYTLLIDGTAKGAKEGNNNTATAAPYLTKGKSTNCDGNTSGNVNIGDKTANWANSNMNITYIVKDGKVDSISAATAG